MRLLLALAIIGATGGLRAQQTPATAAQVLVLVSRNVSDPWAAAEVSGMRQALAEAKPPIVPIVEYLDWQTSSGPDYEEKLATYYATKFAKRGVRVVIAAENAAVEFLLRRRDTLFPGAQAVMCGIPRFDERKRQPWSTGVLETSDPDGTFALALRLQPDLQRFIIIDDSSGAGATAKRMIEAAHPDASQRVQLELRRADTVQETYVAVEDLPPHSAVLLTKSRLVWKVAEGLRDHCTAPIYGTRSPTQLPGILGGSLLDGERQGRVAAQLALRLLAGENPADIPFEVGVPHRLVVDYGQLQRFGIPLTALPPGCEVLNRPLTYWEGHRAMLVASGGVIFALGSLVVGLLWQLRQKRAATLKLDHSHSLLSATFDSIADGVLVVDSDGKVANCNDRFLALWGIPPEISAEKDVSALLDFVASRVADPETFLKRVRQLYANPEIATTDLIEFKDGRVLERDSRPQMQGGEIVGRVSSFRDVTGRLRAEQERERLSAQLAQAQKMEALGTLAGGIAHDFNNMLTGILGCSMLARERLPATHPAVEELDHVITSGERASELVRQILAFSRKRPPEMKVVPIEPIVRETLKLLRATAPAGIELAAEIHPGVPPVFADSTQLHQVLLNLCTNGIQAMGRGPGELRVLLSSADAPRELRGAHPGLPAGPLVSLAISDTGHGMDAATLARAFEPFYSTKATGEGTGLGLAVVH
ncbi:MAG: ATP-binding protein, partial [Chthoniobacteraceae bacterium]